MKNLVVATVLSLSSTSAVFGATLVQNFDVSGGYGLSSGGIIGHTLSPDIGDISIDGFDPSLGTLTSATVNYSLTINAFDMTFISNFLSVRRTEEISLLYTDGVQVRSADDNFVTSLGFESSTNFLSNVTLSPGQSAVRGVPEHTVSFSSSLDVTTSRVLDAIQDTRGFSLKGLHSVVDCSETGFGLGCPSLFDTSGSSSARVVGSVTFEYEPSIAPVPLPAGFPMLIAGLAGLGWLGKRRKALSAT